MLEPKWQPWMAPLPGSDPARLAAIGLEVSARLDADPRVSRIRSPKIDMFAAPGFVSPAECAVLVALIDADVKPSTMLTEGTTATRTSSTCKLPSSDALVAKVEARIAALLGLEPSHAEGMQGQRYQPGQQFRTHNDYFPSGHGFSEAVAAEGGQRTWTAMAYLNRVEKGGSTNFPFVPVAIPPTPGVLLVWNNMDKDGQSNPYAHHAGTVVEAGTKYVLTKWFREREWRGSETSDSYRV